MLKARLQDDHMAENHWHLDKRVPVAIIVAIFLQTAGAIWWAATIEGRVTANEAQIIRLDARDETMRVAAQTQAVQLGRIEEQLTGMRTDIARLLAAIERSQR
jgi:Tfp pilus assembly protein PilO